jgi:hypothetical protein
MRALISLNLSFRAVENNEFRKLLYLLHPSVKDDTPGRTKMRKLLDNEVQRVTKSLFKDLGETTKVNLAIDAWTSPNNLAFLGVVCYYITDNWEYRENLIGFEPLRGSHTGDHLAQVISNLLVTYKLENRLLTITTDNASNNKTMREALRKALSRLYDIKWDADRGRIPCIAHVIQLVVKKIVVSLKIECPYETIPTTFNEDEVLADSRLGSDFGTTLQKVSKSYNLKRTKECIKN